MDNIQTFKEWFKEGEETPRSVTLTNKQWGRLTTFLLMSTEYRKGEADAWARLATGKNEDGSPRFKNAESNARFWKETCTMLDEIRVAIDGM